MKIKTLIPPILIIITFLIGIYFYPSLPQTMASHWGIDNQVNGYSSKNFAVFFLPILMISLYFLFRFLPSVDPYKKNFKEFQSHYENFIILIFTFFLYLYVLTISWNLGYHFIIIQLMSPGLAALFYYAGVLTQNARQNWFVGIRTPWTMSHPVVWQKTHQLGGKLFKLTGLVTLLSFPFPNLAIMFLLIPILTTTVTVFVYSYLEYQKIVKL